MTEYRQLLYIASRSIEHTIALQQLWVPRPNETAGADRLPQFAVGVSMVGAYYDCCFSHQNTPPQLVFIRHYLTVNQEAADVTPPKPLEAMRARLARAYNSLIVEHQLFALCVESKQFDSCYKSEYLDIKGMTDLVVGLGPNHYGFAIQVPTREGNYWIKEKLRRQSQREQDGVNGPEFPVIPIIMNFQKMKYIAGIHIFNSEFGVNVILKEISQMRFNDTELK